jgi:hypothetical protein
MLALDPVTVHRIFGAAVLAFSAAIVLRELNVLRSRWHEFLPATALLLGGILLAGDAWIFHGGYFGTEGRQHAVLGMLIVAAGALEWFRARGGSHNPLFELVIPAALAGLGLSFLWHQQHATGDPLLQMAQHRVMGATLLFAAFLKLAAGLRWREGQWARAGWALVLVVFAVELILYVERDASSMEHTKMSHSQ